MGISSSTHLDSPRDTDLCGRRREQQPEQHLAAISNDNGARGRSHYNGRRNSESINDDNSSTSDRDSSRRSSSSDSDGWCSQCTCSECGTPPTSHPLLIPSPILTVPVKRESCTPPGEPEVSFVQDDKQHTARHEAPHLSPQAVTRDRQQYPTMESVFEGTWDHRHYRPQTLPASVCRAKESSLYTGDASSVEPDGAVASGLYRAIMGQYPDHNISSDRKRNLTRWQDLHTRHPAQIYTHIHPSHHIQSGYCTQGHAGRQDTNKNKHGDGQHSRQDTYEDKHIDHTTYACSRGDGQHTRPRGSLLHAEECTVPFVLAYDDLLSGPFKTFFDCSMKIGGDVAAIAKMVQSTFINQRAFLVMASKSQRPLDTELPQVLEPTGKKIQEVIAFRESKRQSPFFNHLSAISESIPGLSWVAVAPAPAPFVKEMGDSAVFYTNRVLKEYREKDKIHVEWVQNWNNVFKELQEYVKRYHTTGLSWNTRGGNAMANLKAAPANCGVPPPPPAGSIPPPPPMVKLEPKAVAVDDGRSALFESINKGTDITSGLKKVTDDMKTHKNPSLREGPKPFVKQSSPPNRASPARDGPTGRPKFALEGKKWFIEYQNDKPDLIVKDARMDQSVYIFRCQNTVVQVKGKVNSVILDSCKKSSVVFDNLVSSAEVVNCQSCQVQVMGVMPTISIEKTDGCQVYLSKGSLSTEIVTAKSTEMNVLIPKDDGEFVECPIPEQFKTVINGLSLTTTCSEKAG
nr:adenylyl cyclase-associated protein 1-like isoform X2 [Cherax quadricarinatus]